MKAIALTEVEGDADDDWASVVTFDEPYPRIEDIQKIVGDAIFMLVTPYCYFQDYEDAMMVWMKFS